MAFAAGVRHPLALAVAGLAAMTVVTLIAAVVQEMRQRGPRFRGQSLLTVLLGGRRKYAAYVVHVGFACVAIGVTGSSLGTQRQEVTLDEGATIRWADRQVHYVRLEQRQLPDKLVAEAASAPVAERLDDGGGNRINVAGRFLHRAPRRVRGWAGRAHACRQPDDWLDLGRRHRGDHRGGCRDVAGVVQPHRHCRPTRRMRRNQLCRQRTRTASSRGLTPSQIPCWIATVP
jgi:hypothetical protein